MLKPNATVPDRYKVAGPFLDEIFDMEKAKAKSVISGMHATIAIDAWSTMIGVCIYVTGKCYLIETIDTTATFTTEFLVDLLKLQIEQTEKKLECENTEYSNRQRSQHEFHEGKHQTPEPSPSRIRMPRA